MLSSTTNRDDLGATRTALVAHITDTIGPLIDRTLDRGELSDWLALLPAQTLARALRDSPRECAEAVADALVQWAAKHRPCTEIHAVAVREMPRTVEPERSRLVELATAVQAVARDNDGVVVETALIRAGFSTAEMRRLMPAAVHLLALVDAGAGLDRDPPASSAERLLRAGQLAAEAAGIPTRAAA